MNPKKIIHLITTIEFGGAEKQLLILAANQVKQGLEVEVFYLKGKPELKVKFEEVGVKVNSLLVNQPFIFQVNGKTAKAKAIYTNQYEKKMASGVLR